MVMIGLEIHGYILTKEKLFCRCRVDHGKKHSKPNTNICPVCTAQPGSKPLLPNFEAIKKATQIAIALGCKVNEKLPWQRKHYSWPDNPKCYQSTMSGPHAIPNGEKGNFEGIGITECHLEEDPAAWNPETGEIDYNRSGAPLIEIVTDPDFTSADEVIEWLKKLIATLGYIKAIDKKAGIKADVNISIDGGERVELKNINSLRKIKEAIGIELARQEKDLPTIQQTRMYDEKARTTKLMRTKDSALDYRFITDPDLPVVTIPNEMVEELRNSLPETPMVKLEKLIKEYSIDEKTANVLAKKIDVVELFEEIIKEVSPKFTIPWVTVELLGMLNYNKIELEDIEINPEHFIQLLKAIENGEITETQGKHILRSWKDNSTSPLEEIKANAKIGGVDEIEAFAKEAIDANPKAVEDYKAGEEKSMNFLIGQVMRLSNKRADFKTAKEILEKILN